MTYRPYPEGAYTPEEIEAAQQRFETDFPRWDWSDVLKNSASLSYWVKAAKVLKNADDV